MEGEGQGQGGQGSSSPRSRDSQLVETTGTKATVGQPVRAAGVTRRRKEHAQLGIWKVKKEIVFSGDYRKYCFTKSRWWQYPGQGLGPSVSTMSWVKSTDSGLRLLGFESPALLTCCVASGTFLPLSVKWEQ